MAIWLTNFPLPPSVNEYLIPVIGKRSSKNGKTYLKGRLVKSKIHSNYQELCQYWALQNRKFVSDASNALLIQKRTREINKQPFALKIDCFFVFHSERIFTVNNKCEQIDTNNRIKPVLDALVKVIGIDDKHYFGGNCEKVTTNSKEFECSLIRISMMEPRTLDDIKMMIQTEPQLQ